MRTTAQKVWTFLTSMRVGIVLLVLVILLAAVGGIIPQQRGPGFYRQSFPRLSSIILSLRWDRVYSSLLFRGLVGLLGGSLALCTWQRLARIFRGAAGCHSLRQTGSAVVHISLLLILAGALLTGTGYSGKTIISRGHKADQVTGENNQTLAMLPFTVELVRFSVESAPDRSGTATGYRSQVVLRSRAGETTREITMNRPVQYHGHTLAQSGFFSNYLPELILADKNGAIIPETLKVHKTVPLPGTAYQLQITNFYPDFILHGRDPGTRSNDLNNPFIQLEAQKNGQGFAGLYYAVNLNKFIPRASSAKALRAAGLLDSFFIRDCTIKNEYVSVLRITRDPGEWLFYTGGLLLLLGLLGVFFLPHVKALNNREGME